MSKLKFEHNSYDFGDVVHNQLVEWEFPFEGTVEDIDYIHPACGCTSVTSLEDGVIKGTLNIGAAGGNKYNGNNPVQIDKEVQIWENDGQPAVVADGEFKIKRNNTQKKKHVLKLVAEVTGRG